MDRPTYIVFAGVNGAGKSTFYHSGLWRQASMKANMPRVNPDEIVRELGGNDLSEADQLRAGKEALRRINSLFNERQSFNQETTLTGRTALRNIQRAHDEGYRILLYYIGVNSPEKAIERIRHRVEVGGHPIDERTVRRRYRTSLQNLSLVLDLCDEVLVFDNTTEFTAVAQWERGMLSWIGNIILCAPWLLEAIFDESLWRQEASSS